MLGEAEVLKLDETDHQIGSFRKGYNVFIAYICEYFLGIPPKPSENNSKFDEGLF